jgi:hypothetical protein
VKYSRLVNCPSRRSAVARGKRGDRRREPGPIARSSRCARAIGHAAQRSKWVRRGYFVWDRSRKGQILYERGGSPLAGDHPRVSRSFTSSIRISSCGYGLRTFDVSRDAAIQRARQHLACWTCRLPRGLEHLRCWRPRLRWLVIGRRGISVHRQCDLGRGVICSHVRIGRAYVQRVSTSPTRGVYE